MLAPIKLTLLPNSDQLASSINDLHQRLLLQNGNCVLGCPAALEIYFLKLASDISRVAVTEWNRLDMHQEQAPRQRNNGLLRVDLTPYSLKFTDIEVTVAAVSTLVTTVLATPIVEERYKIFVQIASGIGPLSLLSFKI